MTPGAATGGADQDVVAERALRDNAADLLAYLVRRLDAQDAPDVLSTVFATAWRRRADLPADPVAARMWLFGVARRSTANQRRSRARADALTARLSEVLRLDATPTAAVDDGGRDVRDAVGQLPPRQRELVRLVHWDGFTLAEAAQIAGIRASTARTHYARARDALATTLQRARPARPPSTEAARGTRGASLVGGSAAD